MTQLFKVKQNIHEHMQPQKHKDKLKAQSGCVNCFLTVPIEEVARCQYKTVQYQLCKGAEPAAANRLPYNSTTKESVVLSAFQTDTILLSTFILSHFV